MAFPPQFLDELRARLPLSEVVGKRVRLIRAGREQKACCPFHKEKTPSFTVNDQKGFFHCFGCGAHGDVVGFVMRHDNLDFVEAVELLAAQAGLPVPRATPQEEVRQQRLKRLSEVMEAAARWFAARLAEPAGAEAVRYLQRRGVGPDTVADFRLGYAPPDGQALRQHLRKGGFTDEEMVETGLLRQPEGGGSPYSFFRDRVIIPIGDARDRVISFGARLMAGEGPKYLNGPDSPLFRKGESLFNLAKARAAGRTPGAAGADTDAFLVVEGYFDVISLSRAGYAAVAPLGTALTEEQMRVVWRAMRANADGIKAPVLCFDGDTAGRRAAHRFAEKALALIEPSLTLRLAFLPEGDDPDSLLRRPEGKAAFQRCVAEAEPLVDFLWHWKLREKPYETPEERATLRKYFLESVAQIQDRSLQQLYRDEFLNRCFQLWKVRQRDDGRVVSFPGTAPEPRRTVLSPPADVLLVAMLINHPELLEDFLSGLELIHFHEKGHTHTVFRFASNVLWAEPGLRPDELQPRLGQVDTSIRPIIDRLNQYYRTHINRGNRSDEDVREIFLDRLRLQQFQRLKEDLLAAYSRQMNGSELESHRITTILAEIARLHREQNAVLDRPVAADVVARKAHAPVISYETGGLLPASPPVQASALAYPPHPSPRVGTA